MLEKIYIFLKTSKFSRLRYIQAYLGQAFSIRKTKSYLRIVGPNHSAKSTLLDIMRQILGRKLGSLSWNKLFDGKNGSGTHDEDVISAINGTTCVFVQDGKESTTALSSYLIKILTGENFYHGSQKYEHTQDYALQASLVLESNHLKIKVQTIDEKNTLKSREVVILLYGAFVASIKALANKYDMVADKDANSKLNQKRSCHQQVFAEILSSYYYEVTTPNGFILNKETMPQEIIEQSFGANIDTVEYDPSSLSQQLQPMPKQKLSTGIW